jgi:hypothetical protein
VDLPTRIVERFYAPTPPPPAPGDPALARQADAYAGTYLANRRPFSGLEKFAFMFLGQTGLEVTPDGHLIAQGRAWVPAGEPGRFTDGTLATGFQAAPGGAQRWLPAGGMLSFDRIGPAYKLGNLALMCALAAIALVATLAGPFLRLGRQLPQTGLQRGGNVVQIAAAGLWIAAALGLGVFAVGADDQAKVLSDWPSVPIVMASCAALAAALASWIALALSPFAWWGGEGWGMWRKVRFTATSLIFAAFALQLALWGLLEPWAT